MEKQVLCVYYLFWKWSGYIYPLFPPCRDRNDLAEVLALLKTQIDPALLKKQEQETKPEDGEGKKGKLKLLV